MTELIKQLPEGYTGLKALIKKNYQRIDIDNLKKLNLNTDHSQIQNLYKQVIQEILSPIPESIELLGFFSLINTNLETNTDRKIIEATFKSPNIEKIFNEILKLGIIKIKKGKEDLYEFSFSDVQDALNNLTDKKLHEKAIKYYEIKIQIYGFDLNDDIEILYHKAKLNLSEELVNEFLIIVNQIDQYDFQYDRIVDIAEMLMILEDKYKAPILIALGNMFSIIGRSENAEKLYLEALNIYNKLAKQYYRIYLPYVAATQKNLGTLYLDLKRFEDAEKIYSNALEVSKKLEKQYYGVHSTDFDANDSKSQEKSYTDYLKTYNELLKKKYDVYLPDESSISSDLGNMCIDLDLLEDIQDGSIDSLDSYKKLARMCYDMYLVDIAKTQSSLGIVYSELMKFDKAEQMHLESLKIKKKMAKQYPDQVLPELVLTLLDLGDFYAGLNRFEDAEPLYLKALKISKKLAKQNPEVYFYNIALIQNCLGTVYSRLKKFEEAEAMYLEALKIFKSFAREDPKTYSINVADVQNNLGTIYMLLKKFDKAEYHLNKALKADPTNIDILYNFACLESIKENQEKAMDILIKVIELDEDYIERALSDERLDNVKNLQKFKEIISE